MARPDPGRGEQGLGPGVRRPFWSETVFIFDQERTIAVGDGRNDIEMLRWAGRGVAMGQAIEEVREAADAVTGSVHDEGLARELDRYWPA